MSDIDAALTEPQTAPAEAGGNTTDAPTTSAARWAAAIGAQRSVRWSVLGADRDRPGRYVAVVEFPGYAEAMANSGHPATSTFLKELQAICTGEPQFRNLDVRSVQAY